MSALCPPDKGHFDPNGLRPIALNTPQMLVDDDDIAVPQDEIIRLKFKFGRAHLFSWMAGDGI